MLKINVLGYFSTIFTLLWFNVLFSLINRDVNKKDYITKLCIHFAYIFGEIYCDFNLFYRLFRKNQDKTKSSQTAI